MRPLTEARMIRTGKRRGQLAAKVKPDRESKLIQLGIERENQNRVRAFTGCRTKELGLLLVSDLHLDGKQPYISLKSTITKNGKAAEIPIKEDLAEVLREWTKNKLPGAKVFMVPKGVDRIFDRDLAFAGIPKIVDGEVACPHSLRHSFASMLALAGVSPQRATRLLRHSSLYLTMKRYTHIELDDKAQAIASLPDIFDTSTEAVQKTGTDDSPDSETEVSAEVTSKRQKVEKTGSNCQPRLGEEEEPKTIKPHFGAKKGEIVKAADEIRTHDVQLGN